MTMAAVRLEPLEREASALTAPPGTCAAALPWAAIGPAGEAPERLGHQWSELASHAAEANAFAEPWFAGPALRHLQPGEDLKMIEVWSGPRAEPLLVGLMPACLASRYARFPVRHVRNWVHFHSFLGTPLIRAGHEQGFWTAVLEALDCDPWARGFIHVESLPQDGPAHRGLVAAARALGRPCDVVHRSERALLASNLSPQGYYKRTVRKKKRKELKRLGNRLAELGTVEFRRLKAVQELTQWCDAFLALERSGWKGKAGSALGCKPATELFFREVIEGAFAAGKLEILRLDLDGRAIAMLINFLSPPGSFSFKIAYDENYARFSPGVLIQLENLRVLERADIGWMDSCAVENHSMINSLWAERRALVRITLPLAGFKRSAAFRLCRWAEKGMAGLRGRRETPSATEGKADEHE